MGVLNPRPVVDLPMPAGPAVLDTLPALLAALDGTGPVVRPVGTGSTGLSDRTVGDDGGEPVAFAVASSGSSGNPRHALLTAAAVRHASCAGERALGNPAGWLLALPTTGVGGLMVLIRAALAGDAPAVLDIALPFTAARFAAAAATVPDGGAVSLVPTQLHRLLADPAAVGELQRFGTVLIGGAALSPADSSAATEHGIRLVRSYGMTETCGGCVYDGRPLDGVSVDQHGDRLRIRGPVVAAGYLGAPFGPPFGTADGARTFTTGDTGTIVGDGTVGVTGRADDMLISGGVNVAPLAVEHALSGAPGVAEVGVTAVPDAEWGQAIVAVVVPSGAGPELAELRRRAAAAMHPAAAPRHLLLVDALPTRGPGKLDRRALAELTALRLGH